MSLHRLFGILAARWTTALVVALVVFGAAVTWTVMAKRSYTASAAVVVDVKSSDPLGAGPSGVAVSTYMTTQMDVVASERVMSRAVQALNLLNDSALRSAWEAATDGRGDFATWLFDLLRGSLDVRPSRDSNVITIAFSWSDPQFAADMVNAIVRAYTDTALELRIEPARQYNAFFDERSKQLREDFERAQARLSAYERENNLVGSNQMDVESARLGQLSSEVVALQMTVAESESKSNRTQRNASVAPEVLTSPVVTALKADLARKEAEIAELRQSFGDTYPTVRQLQSSIDELTSRIAAETARIGTSVSTSNEVNQRRLLMVRQLLEEQREKVMQLKTQRDEAAVLQRDVQNAERTYDAILARLHQSSLESQNTQSNVSILTEAKAPLSPSSPKVALNLALGLVAGVIFGAAAALAREALDPRVRSADDVLDVIDLPLIVDLASALRSSQPAGAKLISGMQRITLLGEKEEATP